jgi:murein DD-endopeptidase MepM/ murein hydrolase activator NlpD
VARRLALPFVALLALAAPAAGTNPYARKQTVDARLATVRAEIAALQARESTLKSEIAGYTTQIRALEQQIGVVEGRLEPLQRDLDLHERRLARLDELHRLQTQRLRFLRAEYRVALAHLDRRLVGLYETGKPGLLELLLSARSFNDLVDQLDLLRLLTQEDHAIAQAVREARDATRTARVRTARTRRRVAAITRVVAARAAQVREVRDRLAASRTSLTGARGARQATLGSLSAEERAEVDEAAALENVSAQLAARIEAAEAAAHGPSAQPSSTPSAAGFVWPVSGPVTSPFGMRWGRMHEGIDIGVAYGTPIHAAAAGVVIVAGWVDGYGNLVVIDHGGGVATAYGHQERLAVSEGQSVAQGDVIGYVGCTGHCFGPHLHFEVRVNGNPVDPLGYL